MTPVSALQAQLLRARASITRAQLANLDELRKAGELKGADEDDAKELHAELLECNNKFQQRTAAGAPPPSPKPPAHLMAARPPLQTIGPSLGPGMLNPMSMAPPATTPAPQSAVSAQAAEKEKEKQKRAREEQEKKAAKEEEEKRGDGNVEAALRMLRGLDGAPAQQPYQYSQENSAPGAGLSQAEKMVALQTADKNAKLAAAQSDAYVGVIARFDHVKGYGFITCAETLANFGKDIFVGREHLAPGEMNDTVIFSVGYNEKGVPRAHNIRKLKELTKMRKDLEDLTGSLLTSDGAKRPAVSMPAPEAKRPRIMGDFGRI